MKSFAEELEQAVRFLGGTVVVPPAPLPPGISASYARQVARVKVTGKYITVWSPGVGTHADAYFAFPTMSESWERMPPTLRCFHEHHDKTFHVGVSSLVSALAIAAGIQPVTKPLPGDAAWR